MAAIVALLQEILALLGSTSTIVSNIFGLTQHAAQEHAPYAIEKITANAANTVNSPVFGNSALYDLLIAQSAAISLLQAAADPVVLPDPPPPGYGGASSDSITSEVWSYPDPTTGHTEADQMTDIRTTIFNWANWCSMPLKYNPAFYASTLWWDAFSDIGNTPDPLPVDWTDILPDDTLPVFLFRQLPDYTWSIDPASGLCFAPSIYAVGTDMILTCIITPAQFESFKITAVGRGLPPIWPGLDLVTLGSTFALEDSPTIDGPMDGILVTITSVPAKTGAFIFDSIPSYRNLGAVAFVTDNGEIEAPQSLGFQEAIYCPKSMVSADKVLVRAVGGVTGLITTWTKAA